MGEVERQGELAGLESGEPVYVDVLFPCTRTRNWRHDQACHLFVENSPGSLERLHRFARALGLKRCWFQNKKGGMPHYDLSPKRRAAAVAKGAVEVGRRKLVAVMGGWKVRAADDGEEGEG